MSSPRLGALLETATALAPNSHGLLAPVLATLGFWSCWTPALSQSFSEVSVQAGLVSGHVADRLPPDCLYQSFCEPDWMAGGAAAGDIDGDGVVDLVVSRLHEPIVAYRNLGSGAFEDYTTTAGLAHSPVGNNGLALVDIDNDLDLDLYVTGVGVGRYYLYVNDGTGRFTEQAVARNAHVPMIDRDEHIGYSVSFGDFNRDGYPDLHTNAWVRGQSTLLLNRGAAQPGHFDDVTASAGVASTNAADTSFASSFSDMDNDGWPDLVVTADFGNSRLYWNNRDGTFTDGTTAAGVGTDENGMGSTIADVNGDGLLDWFVTSIYDTPGACDGNANCNWGSTGNRLFLNNGDRTFTDATDAFGVRDGAWGWGSAWFDYDNDGDLDLVMTNGVDFETTTFEDQYNDDAVRLWRNDGGTYNEVATLEGIDDTGSGKGLLLLDYDADGDEDVLIVNNNGALKLFQNDVGSENDYLRVRIDGPRGLGARVTLTPEEGGDSIVREYNSVSHFLGQSEIVAHFGLGQQAGPLHELRIDWLGGGTSVWHDLAPNQLITVVETLGDADGDGDVDGDDLIAVQTSFGSVSPPPGDADSDGDVDGDDLIAVQTNFGSTATLASSAIPEPSAALLALAGIAGWAASRRRVSLCASRRGARPLQSGEAARNPPPLAAGTTAVLSWV